MFNRIVKMAVILGFALAGAGARAEQSPISVWDAFLKDKYFKDASIVEDKTVIDMTTPYRAEDAAHHHREDPAGAGALHQGHLSHRRSEPGAPGGRVSHHAGDGQG